MWLIDVRHENPRVDWPRLAIVVVAGEIVAGALVWLLLESVGAIAMLLCALPLAAALIGLDIHLRRRNPETRDGEHRSIAGAVFIRSVLTTHPPRVRTAQGDLPFPRTVVGPRP